MILKENPDETLNVLHLNHLPGFDLRRPHKGESWDNGREGG